MESSLRTFFMDELEVVSHRRAGGRVSQTSWRRSLTDELEIVAQRLARDRLSDVSWRSFLIVELEIVSHRRAGQTGRYTPLKLSADKLHRIARGSV